MKQTTIGIVAGLVLGILDVIMIYPMPFPNKELVLLGAFSNRFAIGFFSATAQFGLPRWLQGTITGFLISILPGVTNPDFMMMIVGLGTVSGLIVGVVTQRLSTKKSKRK